MKNTKKMLLTGFVGLSLLSGNSAQAISKGTVEIGGGLFLMASCLMAGFYKYADNSKLESLGRAWSIAAAMASGFLLRDGIGQNETEKNEKITAKIRRDQEEMMNRASELKRRS